MKKVRNLQKLIPLLPLLLLAILFIFLPIISMIQKSFLSPETGAFTFNNYKTIFTDSRNAQAECRTQDSNRQTLPAVLQQSVSSHQRLQSWG